MDVLGALSGKDEPAFAALAFDVARGFPERELQRVFSADTGRFHSAHAILAITTYHYAMGFFGSEEIARRLESHAPANWPCAERPNGHSIRRFRNRNRLCVQQALERCLLGLCEKKLGADSANAPHFLRLVKAEARMRIHQAELADLEFQF
jgi:hypothetical protein